MKFFIIRNTKILFIYLRLHVVFRWFESSLLNLVYLSRLSAFINKNKKGILNDFPSKWEYQKRYPLYKHVLETEKLSDCAINYLEFGVAAGNSIRWFTQENKNEDSRFYGFDTFTGLPEDWGPFKKGAFSNNAQAPEINDHRVKFYQGLFQQTVPGFMQNFKSEARNIIMLDADICSATTYALTSIAPLLKKGDIIFFDEFTVPTHEFKAYTDFVQAYYINMKLIAAANNYYFAAFKIM